jgi:hypothetical protein
MRQIFSVRFFAAVGAVVALFLLLFTFQTARRVIDDDESGAGAPVVRRIDLVEQVVSSTNPAFALNSDGTASADTQFVIDQSRRLTVKSGTVGEDHCRRLTELGTCAVLADLLGEGVVWFALVPMGTARNVPLPAVDRLDGGEAVLVNGWQLPPAPAFDRRCGVGDDAEEFESYRQFKQLFGEDFTTLYDLDQRQLTAVVCRQRVPYAP